MYYALIDSTDGDILDWFEDVDSAYEASDTTENAEVVAFVAPGRPVPPPPRVYRLSYGVAVAQPGLGLSGDLVPVPA